eukprot:g4234.t1
MSAQSLAAIQRLAELEERLAPLESEVKALDQRFGLDALAEAEMRGEALREVGNVEAALAKVEAEKDQVFTESLESGKGEVKQSRKSIQARVDTALSMVQSMQSRLRQSTPKSAKSARGGDGFS